MEKTNHFGLSTKTSPADPVVPAKKQMIELRKILFHKRGDAIVEEVMNIALQEEHPLKGLCLKMAFDRILPQSEFEDIEKGGGIRTLIVDRSCGGKVTFRAVGGGVVEIEDESGLGSPLTLEHGEENDTRDQ